MKPQKTYVYIMQTCHLTNGDYNLNPCMTAQIEIKFCGVANFGVHNRAWRMPQGKIKTKSRSVKIAIKTPILHCCSSCKSLFLSNQNPLMMSSRIMPRQMPED
jgi:hypothetical protein